MRIKICGVCSAGDARLAERAGADYVGVILAARGPRARTVAEAGAILDGAETVRRVGVFADQSVTDMVTAFTRLRLDVLQLHGAEPASAIADLKAHTGARVWKAVHIRRSGDLERAVAVYAPVADGLLLDGERGGAGLVFDWDLARDARRIVPAHLELIVAGGLNPGNVKSVIEVLKPDVVDVASGVESSVGEKSHTRIEQFVRNARA
jgi:phosphoribosylanthranilate isomerase